MKHLLLIAATALFVSSTAWAQEAKFDEAFIVKKVQKLETDSQNPKKASKPETWLELGNGYYEAATVATTGLYRGLTEFEAKILFPKPEEGTEKIAETDYVKWSYPYMDVFLKDGAVLFWRPTKEIIEGALGKAVAAYKKAYELDPQGMKDKVSPLLEKAANSYKEQADNLYVEHNLEKTADVFAQAYDLQIEAPLNKADTVCSFYAGYLYTTLQKFDRAQKYLSEAIAHGCESNGETYYYLYHAYHGQQNLEKAKETLLAALTKYPKNSQILEELIYLYTEMKEDPNGIVPYIQTALEADPKNAELWAGLGNVYDNIGKSDEAIKAFEKAREIAPDNFNANFNYALMIIRRADTKTSEFNNADYTSNEQQDAALKELNDIYKSAIDPLEKAHSINAEEPMTIELLKNVYFRLRDASPEMMDKYNKYNDLYQKLQK